MQAHRRVRLRALIDAYDGNLSAVGRALGYKDGVFVRQMRDGVRPITEKTVERIESLPGRRGWFGATIPLSPKAMAIGAYYDSATPQERAVLERLIPVDIDITEPHEEVPSYEGGMSGLGDLDNEADAKKRR